MQVRDGVHPSHDQVLAVPVQDGGRQGSLLRLLGHVPRRHEGLQGHEQARTTDQGPPGPARQHLRRKHREQQQRLQEAGLRRGLGAPRALSPPRRVQRQGLCGGPQHQGRRRRRGPEAAVLPAARGVRRGLRAPGRPRRVRRQGLLGRGRHGQADQGPLLRAGEDHPGELHGDLREGVGGVPALQRQADRQVPELHRRPEAGVRRRQQPAPQVRVREELRGRHAALQGRPDMERLHQRVAPGREPGTLDGQLPAGQLRSLHLQGGDAPQGQPGLHQVRCAGLHQQAPGLPHWRHTRERVRPHERPGHVLRQRRRASKVHHDAVPGGLRSQVARVQHPLQGLAVHCQRRPGYVLRQGQVPGRDHLRLR
mmetsp:Transcript_115687/g.360343  ORF Transcript_115687/g.360343 Transcript_115687/m.360343 type:complete len:367 (-) Transcript_115687:471-1571(-)